MHHLMYIDPPSEALSEMQTQCGLAVDFVLMRVIGCDDKPLDSSNVWPTVKHAQSMLGSKVASDFCPDCMAVVDEADPPDDDPVNHPAHYNAGNIEVIDAIEAWGLGFRDGNTVKYVARARHKGKRVEDLKKARWYLDREIALLEADDDDDCDDD